MTDIQTLRDGIVTNLQTISGLRTESNMLETVNPPVAVVQLESISYDEAFRGGLDQYNFNVLVIVSRGADRLALRRLNEYASPTGANSIKGAIESDRSLGSAAQTLRVQTLSNIGSLQLDNQEYYAAEFSVVVYA